MRRFSGDGVDVDVLLQEYLADGEGKEREVGETYCADNIRMVGADDVGQFALERRDDAAAEYHHHEEGRSLRGVASQTGDGKAEDGGPHDPAEQPAR